MDKKRKNGYIEIDDIIKKLGINEFTKENLSKCKDIKIYKWDNVRIIFSFKYENKKYFYKFNDYVIPTNELVANELAKDYKIPCVEYDLAVFNNKKGVISEDFKDNNNNNYIYGEDILLTLFEEENIESHNNLEDIWLALEARYHQFQNKKEIVESIMNKIIDIFIFDIITCQNDRNTSNWGIIENSQYIDIQPIYDNDRILSTNGKNAWVSLTIENEDKSLVKSSLLSFLYYSSEDYTSKIIEKLKIIEKENLEDIFKRINNKISCSLSEELKQYYINEFGYHKKQLENILNKTNTIKK